jgi:hypothetical protein
MVKSDKFLLCIEHFFQVVLCPIEKTMTQWDLLAPVLSTALP